MDNKFSRLIQPGFRFYFLVLILFAAVSAYFSLYIAIAEVCGIVLVYIYYRHENTKRRRRIVKYIETLTLNVNDVTKTSVMNFPFPMVVLNAEKEEIIWCNEHFFEITGIKDQLFQTKIDDVISGFDIRWVIEGKEVYPRVVTVKDLRYEVYGNLVRPNGQTNGRGLLVSLFLINVNDLEVLKKKYEDEKTVISIIVFDNYEEVLKSASEQEKSQILADIDNLVTSWAIPSEGVLRKIDRDRYLYIINEKALEDHMADKFMILDKVRAIQSRDGTVATFSIGIGREGANLSESLQLAGLAVDMALSRGGDQAVIKNKYNFEFFGGRAQTTEKRTKVRSRVMANSFMQILRDSKKVYIMGHKDSDLDSVGSAAGLICIARKLGIPAYIVVNQSDTMASPLIYRLRSAPEYDDVFISPDEALASADSKTLLIVVDTNRPDYVESQSLLSAISRVAVVDHHRRAQNYIDNCLINFHEPYSSSTAELVTELLMYAVTPQDVLRVEAEALLSGIVLDTKWFTIRTGVRTFEASAFLKRIGADTVEVKKLFQSDLEWYKLRYKLASEIEIYKDAAISVYDGSAERSIAAQAADDLLSIAGIRASFVLLNGESTTVISARSLGQVNVQLIMEKLGGGGNLTTAGAQLDSVSVREAVKKLKSAYDSYLEERI